MWPENGQYSVMWPENGQYSVMWPESGQYSVMWPENGQYSVMWPENGQYSVMWPTRQAPVVSHVPVRRGSGARATDRGILSACCSFIGAAAASDLRFVSPLYCSRQESGLQASGKRS